MASQIVSGLDGLNRQARSRPVGRYALRGQGAARCRARSTRRWRRSARTRRFRAGLRRLLRRLLPQAQAGRDRPLQPRSQRLGAARVLLDLLTENAMTARPASPSSRPWATRRRRAAWRRRWSRAGSPPAPRSRRSTASMPGRARSSTARNTACSSRRSRSATRPSSAPSASCIPTSCPPSTPFLHAHLRALRRMDRGERRVVFCWDTPWRFDAS